MSTPLPPERPPLAGARLAAARRDVCRDVCRYVYYRVPAADAGAAIAAVRSAQRSCGAGELLRRPGVGDGQVGLVTLMEVYAAGDAANELAEAAAGAAVAPWLDGGRHVEVFEPVDG